MVSCSSDEILVEFREKMSDYKTEPSGVKNRTLTLCMLASGSRGNAIYISDGSTSVLIDAGLSGIEIERRLKSRNLDPMDLEAVIISHEHSDHIKGAGIISRRFDIPIYLSRGTEKRGASQIGKVGDIRYFESGSTFRVKDLVLHPFSVSHDAEDPVGFTVERNGSKIGIATDLGIATTVVKEHLKGCTALVLESNHDPVMLENGPYPWPLKQRISSRVGHLSNQDSRKLLNEIQHGGLRHVILSHLSENNNTPEKALNEVRLGITRCEADLSVAQQDVCGELIALGEYSDRKDPGM